MSDIFLSLQIPAGSDGCGLDCEVLLPNVGRIFTLSEIFKPA